MASAAHVFTVGSKVWVPDEDEAWKEGVVVAIDGLFITVRLPNKKDEEVTIEASKCCAREEEGVIVDDMVKLAYLNDPAVLDNLRQRYVKNAIYTYTGTILIAANPFMRIPGIYGKEMRALYQGAQIGDLSPHVFAIADNAYRAMMQEGKSQSILISGESGAGKTETTKLVMEYLAGVGGRSTAIEGRNVESQVLESNPLLEAFGNAKTVRNDNSSRFGKFIEIQFDKKGQVSGAAIRSYLLERSRVVQIADPERNYHCFYQLCDGASPEEVIKYRLPEGPDRAKKFHYLNKSNCFDLKSASNVDEYQATRNAMNVIGISTQEQESIFGIVAAILHLGNIEFKEKAEKLIISKASQPHLEAAAALLSCEQKALKQSLITITRKVGGEVIRSALDMKRGLAHRDTLAKTLYSRLFDWIVDKVNRSIGQDSNAFALVGVLDIYGFEHFKVNSFEQFCINLANEKLQQHFNQHVLKLEQEEYEREEIDWSYINFKDNQDVLDLIEGEKGILSVLDSACKLAQTNAEGLTLNLYENFLKHERFSKSKGSVLDFSVSHYAGKVKYSTDEFISKNMDAVIPEQEELLLASSDPFVAGLFASSSSSSSSSGDPGRKGGSKFTSLGRSFKLQLGTLMETLNTTEPHYIRCVKPNPKSKPGVFNRRTVMEQLRSGGVLEAIRMCSAGYPTRRTFDEFVDKFWVLTPALLNEEISDVEFVKQIMKKTALENYQIGKTKVFLRAGQMVVLDSLRLNIMNSAARKIQRRFRLFSFRSKREKAALVIQTQWRGYIARKNYEIERRERAAVQIQRVERGRQARVVYITTRCAIIIIQASFRSILCRKKYLIMRDNHAASTIQRLWRGHAVRKPWAILRHYFLARIARLRLKHLRLEAKRKAELAPPRTKTEVAMETIRMMVLRVMRDKAERERIAAEKMVEDMKEELARTSKELLQKSKEVTSLQASMEEEREKVAHMQREMIRLRQLAEESSQSVGVLGDVHVAAESHRLPNSRSVQMWQRGEPESESERGGDGGATEGEGAGESGVVSGKHEMAEQGPVEKGMERLEKRGGIEPGGGKGGDGAEEQERGNGEQGEAPGSRAGQPEIMVIEGGDEKPSGVAYGKSEQQKRHGSAPLVERATSFPSPKASTASSSKLSAGRSFAEGDTSISPPSAEGDDQNQASVSTFPDSNPAPVPSCAPVQEEGALMLSPPTSLSPPPTLPPPQPPNETFPSASTFEEDGAESKKHERGVEEEDSIPYAKHLEPIPEMETTFTKGISSEASRSPPSPWEEVIQRLAGEPDSLAEDMGRDGERKGGGQGVAEVWSREDEEGSKDQEEAYHRSESVTQETATHSGGTGGVRSSLQESANLEPIRAPNPPSAPNAAHEFAPHPLGIDSPTISIPTPSPHPFPFPGMFDKRPQSPLMRRFHSFGFRSGTRAAEGIQKTEGGGGGGGGGAEEGHREDGNSPGGNSGTGSGMGGRGPDALKSHTFSNFDKVLASMQKEVEVAQRVKEENKWLRSAYKEAMGNAELAVQRASEAIERAESAEREAAEREEELRSAEEEIISLKEKLQGKSKEVRGLSQRLLTYQAANAQATAPMPIDRQQEMLLAQIRRDLGFTAHGDPVAACLVYKALLHWKTFQSGKTNAFDRIYETLQACSRSEDAQTLAYWLCNHVALYYLLQVMHKPEKEKTKFEKQSTFSFFGSRPPTPQKERERVTQSQVDLMLFKTQLATGIERLYVTIRDSAKSVLSNHLNFNSQPGKALADTEHKGATTRAQRGAAARAAGGALKKQILNYWNDIVISLTQIFGVLEGTHVPAFVIEALLRQLLAFIDFKIFNSLMVRSQWCPCTYSNGEVMEEGFAKLEKWMHEVEAYLRDELGPHVQPLKTELCHVQEAIAFLTLDHKPRRTMEEIEELCPNLSTNQLVHICIWYEDDKYGTRGVDPSVTERMWSMMVDDSPMLLRDNEGVPFAVDDVLQTIPVICYEEAEPPSELEDDPTFLFLSPGRPQRNSDLSPPASSSSITSSQSPSTRWDIWSRSPSVRSDIWTRSQTERY